MRVDTTQSIILSATLRRIENELVEIRGFVEEIKKLLVDRPTITLVAAESDEENSVESTDDA